MDQTTCANCGVNGGTNVEVKSVAGSSVNGSHILVQSTPPGSTPVIKGLKMETLNAGLFNYGIEVDATNNVDQGKHPRSLPVHSLCGVH